MKTLLPIFLFTAFFAAVSNAQLPLEAGAFAGLVLYQGDLTEDHIEPSEFNFAFGGLLRYHFNYKWKLRGHVIYGRITGDDATANSAWQQNRGWSYKSFLVETTMVGEYHPFGRSRHGQTGLFWEQWSPYIGAGAGFIAIHPKVEVKNSADKNLFPERAQRSQSISFPFVAGIRWDFDQYGIVTFEGGWRLTFNDYLDGVSQNGNPKKNDPFIFVGFSLSYFIGYEETYNLY